MSRVGHIMSSPKAGILMLEKRLEGGTFSDVYVAHTGEQQKCAVKVVNLTKVDTIGRKFARKEASIIQRLRHEHIIEVLDVINEKETGRLDIVMHFAPNGDLLSYLQKQGRLSEEKAYQIFTQLLSAISYAHDNKIVHRDLKLENILLDFNRPNGEIHCLVADWGFSTHFNPENRVGLEDYVGSLPYAAPEIVLGKPYCGPEIDIWSLGVIMFALVCGTLPFGNDNSNLTRLNILSNQMRPFPESVSAGLRAMLRKMLTHDRDDRATAPWIRECVWMQMFAEKFASTSAPSTAPAISTSRSASSNSSPTLSPLTSPRATTDATPNGVAIPQLRLEKKESFNSGTVSAPNPSSPKPPSLLNRIGDKLRLLTRAKSPAAARGRSSSISGPPGMPTANETAIPPPPGEQTTTAP